MKIETETRYVANIKSTGIKAEMLAYLDRCGAVVLGEFDPVRGIVAKNGRLKLYCIYGCAELRPGPRTTKIPQPLNRCQPWL